jgi:hypothetical protein
MKHNFTIRIYKSTANTTLAGIQCLILSGLPIISKQNKFGGVCLHHTYQKKFGYTVELKHSKRVTDAGGSHSYPVIGFKGEYLDIIVKNFPRYPAIYADYHACRYVNDPKYFYGAMLDQQFPAWTQYRKFEIIPIP